MDNFETLEASDRYQTISIHRFVVFIGPLFFILGMVIKNFFLNLFFIVFKLVFGVSLLCMSILRNRKRRSLQRYANSTLKYNLNNNMPKTFLKYNNRTGVTRDFLNSTMLSTTSISAPIFSSSIPPSLLQNLTSLQTEQQSELHRYNVNPQSNANLISEGGVTNCNNILLSRDLTPNLNINNESANEIINRNYYIHDNNNAHNRYYGHRNVHF